MEALLEEDTLSSPQTTTTPTGPLASMIKQEQKRVAVHVKKKTRRSRGIGNINNWATTLKAVPPSNVSPNNKVGVLTQVAVPVQDHKTLNKLLLTTMACQSGRTAGDTVVVTMGTESVEQSSFSCLNGGI